MGDIDIDHTAKVWEEKTTAANNLFSNEIFEEALFGYHEALYYAEILNKNFANCINANIPFIQLYIISCNNLANTYLELNQNDQAENMFRRVIYYLLNFSEQVEVKTGAVHRELNRAVIIYTDFINRSGNEKQNQQELFREVKEQLIVNGVILTN